MNYKQIFNAVLYLVMIPITLWSFIFFKLNNDVHIYMGVEYIADKFYPFPYGFDLAWEIKPIGNRILNWALYKFATLFVSFDNHVMYAILVKLLVVAIAIGVAWYFASKLKYEYIFPLVLVALFAIGTISEMQPEWWAAVIGLLIVALLHNDDKYSHFVVGLLFVAIGLLKGITGLLFIPILCAAYLLTTDYRRWNLLSICAGFSVASISFFILNATIWNHMLSDMFMSSTVAHVGFFPWSLVVIKGLSALVTSTMQMPVVLSGVFFIVVYIDSQLRKHNIVNVVAFCIMWVAPFVVVVIQSELMIYHFYMLVIPAIATIILVSKVNIKSIIIPCVIVFSFCVYFFFLSMFGVFAATDNDINNSQINESSFLISKYHLDEQPSVLYLEHGMAPYFFMVNSSCRYSAPLMLVRNTNYWNISHLKQYQEEYDCVKSYQGEYIILYHDDPIEDWVGENQSSRAPLMTIIHNNYTVVNNGNWRLLKKNYTP